MNLIDRIKGLLEDRDITDGQLRVAVDDETNLIVITIDPNSNSPDYYSILNSEVQS